MKELLKKKGVRIGLLVIILLVAIGIIGLNAQSAQRREEYNGHIEAAEKYLSDLDYEQAIAEYTLALQINPKSEEVLSGLEEAYLAYAESIADTGDYERAIAVLEEGYAVVQRESLAIRIEEYRNLVETDEDGSRQESGEDGGQQETEKDGSQQKMEGYSNWREIKGPEEAKAVPDDAIRQMVESDEFRRQLNVLWGMRYWRTITDEQARELCRPMIEVLERYRKLYPESWYYQELPCLYYLAGEYELCAQLIGEFRELFPDNNNLCSYYKYENGETTRDEYGRIVSSTGFFYDKYNGNEYEGKQVEEYEYGQNGKLIRTVSTNDTGRSGGVQVITTSTREYEYDLEGRVSKITGITETNLSEPSPFGPSAFVLTFEYSEEGFITYENGEGYGGAYKITRNYVIDGYGEAEMVGEADYQEIQ